MDTAKQQLKDTFTNHWTYLALNAACELEIFDKIHDAHHTLQSLAHSNNWNMETLGHLIGFCINEEYIRQSEEGILSNSEKGNLLRKENPDGLYYACLLWADEHLNAWQNLAYSIRTGKTSFEHLYGQPFFSFLSQKPKTTMLYHKAIDQYARDDYHAISSIIDFSIHESIMDVGGSYGSLIRQIKFDSPSIDCYLFDLPNVISNVSIPNIHLVSGDFFDKIPKVSEAIILSRVLHDWNDEQAKRILTNCHHALPENGRIYIIEIMTDRLKEQAHLLNLNMKAMCDSYERTEKQFVSLLSHTGLKINHLTSLNELQSIIIAEK